MEFEFDADAVASSYGPDAATYAARYGDHLETNDFDRTVLTHVLADLPPGALVLDAGCGPAQAAAFVEARALRAIALDLTREMLDEARERVFAPLVQGDLRALPFAPLSFDAVIAWFSLLHLPTSTMPAALADIRRILRVDAPLVVALHGQHFGVSVEWSAYTEHELASLLIAAGFSDVVARTRPPAPGENPVTKVIVSGVR